MRGDGWAEMEVIQKLETQGHRLSIAGDSE